MSKISELQKKLDAAQKEIERLKPFEPMLLPSDFPVELRVGLAKGFLSRLVDGFDALNGDCNYSVTEAQCQDRKYEITVRRWDKPTPHDLRKKAEAERDAALIELAELKAKGN